MSAPGVAAMPRYRVITPSGPVERDAFAAALALARARGIDAVCEAADADAVGLDEVPWLAGSDTARAERWCAAIAARPDGIWMARGGVGAMRVLAATGARLADVQGAAPVPIWGFSDGTALLADAYRRGWPAWMAPPVTQLPRLDAPSLARTVAAMCKGSVADFEGLSVLAEPTPHEGSIIEGPLFAANLAVLASLCGTPWQPELSGAVLVLEDVGEAGFRVDRFVHQLFHAGVLRGLAAIVFGDFGGVAETEVARIGRFLRAFAAEHTALAGVPILGGLPVGHGAQNAPLPVGRASGWCAQVSLSGPREARTGVLGFRRWC